MDIYRLDSNYERMFVIDDFRSFIWTERYSDVGDFELVLRPTAKNRKELPTGSIISHSETNRLMRIEKIFRGVDRDGERTMNISGRSYEGIFYNRAIGPNRDGAELSVKGTPAWVAWRLVTKICINGEDIYALDKISNLEAVDETNLTKEVNFALAPKDLFSVIKDLCETENLGFKITLTSAKKLRFSVYKGVKRPNVIFSSDLDNLDEESYLKDTSDFKNTAYVWTKDNQSRLTVYAKGYGPQVSGLNRRILHVSASDVDYNDYEPSELQEILTQRGEEALKDHIIKTIFDGKLTSVNPFNYNQHYFLGDTVTLLGDEGEKQETTVTEYIWAWDTEGLRSYPTFSIKE